MHRSEAEGRFGEMHRRSLLRREPARSAPEGAARRCAEPEAMTRPQVASRSEVARGLRTSVCARATRIGVLHLAAGKPTESSLRPRGWMYSPEIREPRQRKRQTAAISPTYGDDDQSGQDKSPCSTHLHNRKTNFTFVYFQNVRLLLDGALKGQAFAYGWAPPFWQDGQTLPTRRTDPTRSTP